MSWNEREKNSNFEKKNLRICGCFKSQLMLTFEICDKQNKKEDCQFSRIIDDRKLQLISQHNESKLGRNINDYELLNRILNLTNDAKYLNQKQQAIL